MIDQIFTNICSIMAASDSWNIAFYCGRIFTQSLPNSEIIQNCVVIVFLWRMRFPWLTFQQLWPRYGDPPYKVSRSLVKYCTNWLSNWHNVEQFFTDLKKISRSFGERTDSLFLSFLKEIYCILYKDDTDRYIISKLNKNETEFQYGLFQKRDYLGRYT